MDDSFYKKAALAGIKNLDTKSYNNDSSILKSQDRFPEKYTNTATGPGGYSSRKHSNNSRLAWQPKDDNINFSSSFMNKLEGGDPSIYDFKGDLPIQRLPKMSKSEQQLVLEAAFSAVCDNIMTNQMGGNTDTWLQLSIDDKLLQFASFLSHMRKDYRLGAIVGVYILYKNNHFDGGNITSSSQASQRGHIQTSIGNEITKVIIEEVFSSLTEFKNQDPLLILCELEVIGLWGSREDMKTNQRLSILKNLLTDQEAIVQNDMVPNVLAAMVQVGFEGLRELIDIAERDVNGLQGTIVKILIKMRVL